MDLDGLDEPSNVRKPPSRFAPTSKKPQPKSKPKPKPEPQESVPAAPKFEPSVSNTGEDAKPKIDDTLSKTGMGGFNGDVKMEIDAKEERGAAAKENDPMDVDKEEDDVVVREIDVYFTPSVDPNTQLYVMQYPLRPRWRPYELDERCKEVRVKPESTEVEVDLSIDDTKNYDPDIASRLNMKKQTLSSSWSPPPATGYAVGVLIGNKLHLNPIHTVVQLRPSMDYLSSGSSKGKKNATSGEDSNEGKPSSLPKKQSKQMSSGNEQKPDVESWIPLKYHGSKSDLSSRYLQNMVAQESSNIEFAMSPYDYMSSLCPGITNNNIKLNGPSRRVLLSLPLEERIKRLFLEGPPIHRFAALRHLIPDDSIEDLLTVLQEFGQLVQGLWVPKTSLLFPSPKPNEKVKLAARDYILLLFSKSLVVTPSQLNVPMKPLLLKSFLNIFAVERPSFKDWKFKENMDTQFVELYPDIVRKQEQAWEVIGKNISVAFDRAGKSVSKIVITKPKKTMTDETREALRKALPKVLQTHKVCSFEMICQGLRQLAISQSTLPKADPRILVAAASGAEAPPEELQEVISEVATNIHGFYVLKSSPEHPDFDPLRKVVIGLFLARGPNANIKKSEVQAAARHELKREPSNSEYIKVMTDLCESKGSAWVLKSGDAGCSNNVVKGGSMVVTALMPAFGCGSVHN
ncbi:DNA-DIRECTED RNA polymeraseS III 80 KDA POLYPEPTIDE RNA polymerase III SUBUNIT 5 [Salix koriyanagi]|uniref:DNA-DIRECTED RNA polymeraseS III 80 kDa POLYPEPTIDE RNA polymerase III SUBUNIT 5 n=1 Tax=Salix koriyanagi TaxID=2511006 RepID=A0A9Q0UMJ7_9ROSI|nr:DNA-DIRECTED RNA polymeraseS III 80 KDA POLYPEPTIDE RNA polymerase III SUBUNIT 5 [Salix koriyanagi]